MLEEVAMVMVLVGEFDWQESRRVRLLMQSILNIPNKLV